MLIKTWQAHVYAVRLLGLMFCCAFLGNVMDGPVMWLLTPPSGGWTANTLVYLNAAAMLPAVAVLFRPQRWLAVVLCWVAWFVTYNHGNGHGGDWFFDGWDTMLMDLGFLGILLSWTLSLYEDEAPRSQQPAGALVMGLLGSKTDEVADLSSHAVQGLVPCSLVVQWSRALVEFSLTLTAFRLFFGCGLLKINGGDKCWRDFSCLFDFFEMQMNPTALAWYIHNYMPRGGMQLMQFFAINIAECTAPVLLLGFGVCNMLCLLKHNCLSQSCLAIFAAIRQLAGIVILGFVLGMFLVGNFAFLHPLSVVPVVASMGSVHGVLLARTETSKAYAQTSAVLIIVATAFAFLPSLEAYAWMWNNSPNTGPALQTVMSSRIVKVAADMNLGIPYQRHDYFANGLVHTRNEMALFANNGTHWLELNIPFKDGSVDRISPQTSPLHRRFAWMWWFLSLECGEICGDASRPEWFFTFLEQLCERDEVAWAALEPGHGLSVRRVQTIAARMYSYRFAEPGQGTWWVRQMLDNVTWPGLGSTHIDKLCV